MSKKKVVEVLEEKKQSKKTTKDSTSLQKLSIKYAEARKKRIELMSKAQPSFVKF